MAQTTGRTTTGKAVDAAVAALYEGQEPMDLATMFPGTVSDPLKGVSVFRARGFWHLVTCGLADRPVRKGGQGSRLGFELSLRVVRAAEDDKPPPWAGSLLKKLAKYAARARRPLATGHYMGLPETVTGAPGCRLVALLFADDPDTPQVKTPAGTVRILRVYGATPDEARAAQDWDGVKLVEQIVKKNPLLVTDPHRVCLLEDQFFAERVEGGIRRDGSSTGGTYARAITWEAENDKLRVCVSYDEVEALQRMLRGRLPFERPYELAGKERKVTFCVASKSMWQDAGNGLAMVGLSRDLAERMMKTFQDAGAGTYEWSEFPGLVIQVGEGSNRPGAAALADESSMGSGSKGRLVPIVIGIVLAAAAAAYFVL